MSDRLDPLQTCPLCGGPNACAVAACGGAPDAPCWCRSANFKAEALAAIPLEKRGQVCVCERCATTIPVAPSSSGGRTKPA